MRVLLALLLTANIAFGKDPYPVDADIDVQHYKYSLTVVPEDKTVSGTAEITVRFVAAGKSTFSLDLDDINKDNSGMKISGVTSSGQALSYKHVDDRIQISLSSAPSVNSVKTFIISYEGRPSDGLIIGQNSAGQTSAFADNWPNRAHFWIPCIDHPSDKATVEFIITAPREYDVIANGVKLSEDKLPKGMQRTHWKNTVPIPTKVAVIGLASFDVKENGRSNGIPVSSWVYEGNERGLRDFDNAVAIQDFFSEWIGEFPYSKLAHVQSKTEFGGMENAGNIFYNEKKIIGTRDIDRLIAHETAHQWFGNSVSEDDWHHVWLSESFATYLTMIYVENAMGKEAMLEDLESAKQRVINYHNENPRSMVIDTSIVELRQLLSANTYQKGGWVLHMLRRRIGDENFQALIRAYYQKFRDGNALTSDFQQLAEEISGQDLEYFFQRWLYQAGIPQIDWRWRVSQQGDRIYIRIKQTQPLAFRDLKMDVAIYYNNSSEPIMKSLDVGYTAREISFRLTDEVDRVELDPDQLVLFDGKTIIDAPSN